jgi:hypothetical protein
VDLGERFRGAEGVEGVDGVLAAVFGEVAVMALDRGQAGATS